ncbi:hypothetical protein FJZ36_10995 [Candidatus Poribacteria bacterium]|nr:hypothetical protein [Candidatus Poribacteria bacterium]
MASRSATVETAPQPAISGVTARTWVYGAVLVPVSVYWMLRMEMLSGGSTRGGGSALGGAFYPTAMSVFFNVVFLLLALVAVSRLLPKRFALDGAELLTLYAMVSAATAVSGVDMIQVLVPMAAYPTWFASPENDWENTFARFLPSWWVVRDRSALEGFYVGGDSFYRAAHLRAWLPVVGAWLAFLAAMLLVFGGLVALLRKQWIERERLSYPIVQLPLELAGSGSGLLGNRLFWLGVGVTGMLTVYNTVAYLVPVMPLLVWSVNLGEFVREHPWRAIGFTPLRLFPFVISMVFLIPQELSFSGWFFYWLAKGLRVLGAVAGFRGLPEFPYARHQSFGAYLAIFAFAIWAGRRQFIDVLRRGWRGSPREEDEPISGRGAILCMVGGFAFLVAFSARAGMAAWVAVAFFAAYFILMTGITRVRAELGAPVHDLHFLGPERMIVAGAGSRRLGAQNLALLSVFYWFNRAYRCVPMPIQLEGLKLAQAERIRSRGMFWATIAGGVVGGLSVWWMLLHAFYREGGLSGIASYAVGAFGREPFVRLEGWLAFPSETDVPSLVAIVIGAVVSAGLLVLRTRYVWWPLHPLGYALADDYAMNWIWSSVLAGWFLKVVVLRATGIRGYRKALPLFLGFIMGEFAVGSIASLVAIATGHAMYAFKNW